MIVEVILSDGIGRASPLVLHANQLVVRQDNGTPIGVFAHYGPEGAYAASISASCTHCGKGVEDFNRMLRALGVHSTVVVDKLVLPKPPPGAKLVASPKPHE